MDTPSAPRNRDEDLVETRVLAEPQAVARMWRRVANEIVERNGGTQGVVLVGIRTGGLYLAEWLQTLIAEIEQPEVSVGAVDITLYRDDVFVGLPRPEIGATELPFELEGVTVVLVDDVLYTGRTVRAALDALMDYGRPKAVQLAVLIDRGLRELPIRSDYVGLSIDSQPTESVRVLFSDDHEVERVVVRERKPS